MSDQILERFQTKFAERLRDKEVQSGRSPNESKLILLIVALLKKNRDCRIIITGEPGVGKSTLALRIAEILNPEVYVRDIEKAVEEGICFTAKEFIKAVRTFLSCSVIIFDEAAQGWYHRQFMSMASMILSKILIGFRFKQFVSILCIPNIELLDADALRLVTFRIEITSQGNAEVFRVMKQKFGGAPWNKKVIDHLTFGKPDVKLWNRYEKRKTKFQEDLYDKYGKQLDEMEKPLVTLSDIIERVRLDRKLGNKTYEASDKKGNKTGKLSVTLLQNEFGLGLNKAYQVKRAIEDEVEADAGGIA